MKVSIVQSKLYWEDSQMNREHFSAQIDQLGSTDLIILPEMFPTGFTMQPTRVAESMDGETVSWMKTTARAKNAAICGSVAISENGRFYNRLLFVAPSGEISHYDKRHLFTLAGEDKQYTPGHGKLILEYKDFRICPLVCYDLRFPVFSRNAEDYDLLIYVANWPEPRIVAWDTLLRARAIENMSFVVGVNRVGADENGHQYIGHSQVFDALGNLMNEIVENEAAITVNLDKNHLSEARRKFAFLNDRDEFKVI